MADEQWAVVLFHSSNHAVRAEKLLTRANLSVKLMPVPRHLSSDCGFCARIRRDDRAAVETLFAERRVEYSAICDV